MKRVFVIAALVTLAPFSAFAEGCKSGHGKQAQSCADGSEWDATQGTCVKIVSS